MNRRTCHWRFQRKVTLDLRPGWRAELTELYEEVNRAWLARKAFLFVLIGGDHVGGSGSGPAGEGSRAPTRRCETTC